MQKELISSRQFTILVALDAIGTGTLIIPSTMVGEGHQDAWIGAILGILLGILLILLYIQLANRNPGLHLFQMNERYFGKWIGKVFSFLIVYLTTVSSAELLYFVGNFMGTAIMPDTPQIVFHVLFAVIVIYAVRLGVETFTRSAELLAPLFAFLFAMITILVAPDIKFSHLEPVLHTPVKKIVSSAFFFTGIFALPQFFLLTLHPSFTNRPKEAAKGYLTGSIIGGIVLLIIILLSLTVLGVDSSARQIYSSYTLAKTIDIGNIIQRIEIIMAMMWIITIFYRLVLYFFTSVMGIATITNSNAYRPFVLPLGMLVVVLSMVVHPTSMHAKVFNKEIWFVYAATFTIAQPIIMLLIGKIRGFHRPLLEQPTPKPK